MQFWPKTNATSQTIQTLRRFDRNIRLVPAPPAGWTVPDWWRGLAEREPADRVADALTRWDSDATIKQDLRRSLTYLHEHCTNVEIVASDSLPYLIYTVERDARDLRYFAGGNPLMPEPTDWLREAWPTVPDSIRTFYTLHDGFFDFPSGSGISPQRWVGRLSDDDWGIIDTLGEPVRINLRTSLDFVSNGAGGHVVIDLDDCVNGKATLWWAKYPPDYDQNFWDVADEWLLMFLSEP